MNQPWDGVADSEDAATLACNTDYTECMKDPKVAKTEVCTTKKEECLKKIDAPATAETKNKKTAM